MPSIERRPLPEPTDKPAGIARRVFPGDKPPTTLSFDERCFIAALYIERHSIGAIAALFGIYHGTVRSIIRINSKYYKNVRDKLGEMGQDEFVNHYFAKFPEKLAVIRANKSRVVQQSTDPDAQGFEPNKSLSSRAGRHSSGQFEVLWKDSDVDPRGKGWYCRDEDGDHGPFGVSSHAYMWACYIYDRPSYVEPEYIRKRRLNGEHQPWRVL